MLIALCSLFAAVMLVTPSLAVAAEDILVADFEGPDYGAWKTTGDAFGTGPARGTLPRQMQVSGFEGEGLVNSFLGGDNATGTLTSPAFPIQRDYLNFLVGGGKHVRLASTCWSMARWHSPPQDPTTSQAGPKRWIGPAGM